MQILINANNIEKLKQAGAALRDSLFPPTCPACGKPLPFESGRRLEICRPCREKLVYMKEPRCLQCGKELEEDAQEFCHDCLERKHLYQQGTAVYSYTDCIQHSIYRFKYENKREYAAFYGREIQRSCGTLLSMWEPQVIIPVPLHSTKLFKRGYNQAALIARELGSLLQIPVDEEILVRSRKTTPMKELDNHQRLKNLENAFQCQRNSVKYRKVLIVDDIYTTGATVDACAKVLLGAGVEEVYCVCLCIGNGF